MKNFIHGMVLSLQFLTRFPLPIACDINTNSMKWALRFFPFAGLLIGCFISVVFFITDLFLPTTLVTLAILSAWVYATGGLHLDGWMDVADAVGSNGSLDKKYEIMKDSRIGSFAVLAVIFLFIWKAGFLYELVSNYEQHNLIIAFLFIPALARFQALLMLKCFPPIQNKGLAHMWRQYLSWSDIVIALCWLAVIIVLYYPLAILLVLQVLFTFVYGKWAVKNFNGINGDLVGTSIEGAELWNVMILFVLFSFVMG
ncbi:adenosylcobinamide-GDP ribazoletransferase [Bacillus massiliigorillae]|uniref:adenosylcobinamide-GDP ribazoletransferase n=1 Tax=Bacillus massiliigorillae TaxID=1243664 RepID=UPI0003A52B5B|nr:adenosylcobinamide-GDP ribazoletransferase [Bacillus massiliigorillae]